MSCIGSQKVFSPSLFFKKGWRGSGAEPRRGLAGATAVRRLNGAPKGALDGIAENPTNNEERLKNQMASNEKVRIKVKGYEHSVVDAAAAKIVEAAKRGGARVAGPIPLPTDKQIVTILRAVHKYKDSREQFELRTHKRLIDVIRPNQKTIEALQGLELPAGVEISMDI